MGLLGLLLALGAIAIAQLWHGGSLLTLVDGPAFLIVLGGTVGAVTLQTPAKYILLALRQLLWIFTPPRQILRRRPNDCSHGPSLRASKGCWPLKIRPSRRRTTLPVKGSA